MKTKTTTKLLSALLAVVMLVSAVPLGGLAGLDLFSTKASALSGNVGDIVEFGSYPQSKVTDTATLNELNKRLLYWQSYGYYSGNGSKDLMLQGDWMKYADTELNGIKYRAVVFTQYRPIYTTYTSSAELTYQDDNGYYTNTVYWFKYEPLKWRILDPVNGLVLSETCIDSQTYCNTKYYYNGEYYNDAQHMNYASDYKTSSIRKWLNDDFYNTAFTASQKAEIAKTNLDNSSPYYNNKYGSESTNDKIFLLSYNEMLNSSYGFSTDKNNKDVARRAKSTDYAKAQGCWQNTSSSYQGNARWFLRSPGHNSLGACHVYYDGNVNSNYDINETYVSVRPALRIHPTSDIPTSSDDETVFPSIDSDFYNADPDYTTLYGIYEASTTVFIANINEKYSEITINGKTYKLDNTVSVSSKYKGKKVVFTLKDNKVIWIKCVDDMTPFVNYKVTFEDVKYENGIYNNKSTTANVVVSNCCSDFIGDYTVLSQIPELTVRVNEVNFSTYNEGIVSFNGKNKYYEAYAGLDLPMGTTKRATFVFDNLNLAKPEDSLSAEIGYTINFDKFVKDGLKTENALGKQVIGVSSLKLVNVNAQKPEKPVPPSQQIDVSKEAKAAAAILESSTSAISITDPVVCELLTSAQVKSIEQGILCMVAMSVAPKDTFEEYLSKKVIEKAFKIDTNFFGMRNGWLDATVLVNTQKYGQIEMKFICEYSKVLFSGSEFAYKGEIKYEIIGGSGYDKLPQSMAKSGLCGMLAGADIGAFCKAAYEVAKGGLKSAYNVGYGNDLNKAVDILFGKTVNNILKCTKYKSVAGLTWEFITLPSTCISIHCPVDVFVYNSNDEIVAAVVENEVIMSDENVIITVDGDEKYIELFDDTYRIGYRSTAEGEMRIEIEARANSESVLRTVSYEDVPLQIGINYLQDIGNDYTGFNDYDLISNDGGKIEAVSDVSELHWHESDGTWYTEKEATHDCEGVEYSLCTICHQTFERVIPKLTAEKILSVKLNTNSVDTNYNRSFTLTPNIETVGSPKYEVKYSSSNTDVATVDQNGNVKTTGKGNATITVTVTDSNGNAFTDTCNVNVKFTFWQWLLYIICFGWIWM